MGTVQMNPEMTDTAELARRTLKAGDDFREAALYADRVMSLDNGKATARVWSSITSVIRRASTLDAVSEKLARSVLDE